MLADLEMALWAADHLTAQLFHPIITQGTFINHLHDPGNPAPDKMTPRRLPATVLGQPSDDMMAGKADDTSAFGAHLFKVDNAQAAILIKGGKKFQFRFNGPEPVELAEQGLETEDT